MNQSTRPYSRRTDPTNLTPHLPYPVNPAWYEAHWYGAKPRTGPGPLRYISVAVMRALQALAARPARPVHAKPGRSADGAGVRQPRAPHQLEQMPIWRNRQIG
jgi:hypothetical protein